MCLACQWAGFSCFSQANGFHRELGTEAHGTLDRIPGKHSTKADYNRSQTFLTHLQTHTIIVRVSADSKYSSQGLQLSCNQTLDQNGPEARQRYFWILYSHSSWVLIAQSWHTNQHGTTQSLDGEDSLVRSSSLINPINAKIVAIIRDRCAWEDIIFERKLSESRGSLERVKKQELSLLWSCCLWG